MNKCVGHGRYWLGIPGSDVRYNWVVEGGMVDRLDCNECPPSDFSPMAVAQINHFWTSILKGLGFKHVSKTTHSIVPGWCGLHWKFLLYPGSAYRFRWDGEACSGQILDSSPALTEGGASSFCLEPAWPTILKDDEWVKEILGCLREEKKTNEHNEKLKLKAE